MDICINPVGAFATIQIVVPNIEGYSIGLFDWSVVSLNGEAWDEEDPDYIDVTSVGLLVEADLYELTITVVFTVALAWENPNNIWVINFKVQRLDCSAGVKECNITFRSPSLCSPNIIVPLGNAYIYALSGGGMVVRKRIPADISQSTRWEEVVDYNSGISFGTNSVMAVDETHEDNGILFSSNVSNQTTFSVDLLGLNRTVIISGVQLAHDGDSIFVDIDTKRLYLSRGSANVESREYDGTDQSQLPGTAYNPNPLMFSPDLQKIIFLGGGGGIIGDWYKMNKSGSGQAQIVDTANTIAVVGETRGDFLHDEGEDGTIFWCNAFSGGGTPVGIHKIDVAEENETVQIYTNGTLTRCARIRKFDRLLYTIDRSANPDLVLRMDLDGNDQVALPGGLPTALSEINNFRFVENAPLVPVIEPDIDFDPNTLSEAHDEVPTSWQDVTETVIATQTTGAKVNETQITGKKVIEFDGVDDFFTPDTILLPAANGNYAVIIVAKIKSGGSTEQYFLAQGDESSVDAFTGLAKDSNVARHRWGTSDKLDSQNNVWSNTQYRVVGYYYDSSLGIRNRRIYCLGDTTHMGVSAVYDVSTKNTHDAEGDKCRIGCRWGAAGEAEFLAGYIARMQIFYGFISFLELQAAMTKIAEELEIV